MPNRANASVMAVIGALLALSVQGCKTQVVTPVGDGETSDANTKSGI